MPVSRKRKQTVFGGRAAAKLALMGLTLGAFGATTANASPEAQQEISTLAQSPKEMPKPVTRKAKTVQARRIAYNGKNIKGSGLSPKYFGQWLQATGRQKWVKKSSLK